MGVFPNFLQIENLLDLVEYLMRDSSKIGFMLRDFVSYINKPTKYFFRHLRLFSV